MSEREYFSVRYLVPGSTFLLLILAYNIFPLYRFLGSAQTSVSLFSAVLAVLGSPTVGFLVSQFWWEWFQWRRVPWKIGGAKLLADKFSLNQRNALIVYDYVLHSKLHSNKEMSGLSKYAFRRYDNYVLLSCTNLSLVLGTVLGLSSRASVHYFSARFEAFPLEGSEVTWLVIVFVATVILKIFIWDGRRQVGREHKEMHEAVIRALITDLEIDEKRLREIFPPEYFKKETENIKETEQERLKFDFQHRTINS